MATHGLTPAKTRALHRLYSTMEGPVPIDVLMKSDLNPYALERGLRKWAARKGLLDRINDEGEWKMNVKDLHEALGSIIENGHGDAEVAHVNGTGKATRVVGWELVTSAMYEPQRGAAQRPPDKQLKLHTAARF